MALSPGARLGPYEILSVIGAGGMGEVYRARDTRLDRVVAIKRVLGTLVDDQDLRARFQQEARTIAALNHPHICTIHDVGHDYLVMEHLAGETRAARLARPGLSIDEALRIAIHIAEALDRAHRAGIVHRDLKPANVMLVGAHPTTESSARRSSGDTAQVKLLDFGLAKRAAAVARGDLLAIHMTGDRKPFPVVQTPSTRQRRRFPPTGNGWPTGRMNPAVTKSTCSLSGRRNARTGVRGGRSSSPLGAEREGAVLYRAGQPHDGGRGSSERRSARRECTSRALFHERSVGDKHTGQQAEIPRHSGRAIPPEHRREATNAPPITVVLKWQSERTK
jgi:serine/threonine protein kinase